MGIKYKKDDGEEEWYKCVYSIVLWDIICLLFFKSKKDLFIRFTLGVFVCVFFLSFEDAMS